MRFLCLGYYDEVAFDRLTPAEIASLHPAARLGERLG